MLHAITVLAGQLLAANTPTITELPDRDIRIENLVDGAGGMDEATRNLVVARMPEGARQVEITTETAHRLISNRIPGQRFRLAFDDTITFSADAAPAGPSVCFAAAQGIARGAIISIADVADAPCEGRTTNRAVGYDRQSAAPVAVQAISAGSFLGPIRPAEEGRLRQSEEMILVTGGGGVTIRRAVTTLQPAREGQRVFVTTADGEVFAVPYANLEKD